MNREVSTQKELGSFVYDARIKLGLTQEALAERAGVSRKWLIGLEQGVRTRAELGKILDTFDALGISINLSINTEPQVEPSDNARHQSLADISLAARDALKKATNSNQSFPPKLAPSNTSQSAFQSLAASALGESSFQKLAKELGNQTGFRNLAASPLSESAFQKLASSVTTASSLRRPHQREVTHSDASTLDPDANTALDIEEEFDQTRLDADAGDEHENRTDDNDSSLQ